MEFPLKDGRWTRYRYRKASDSLEAGVRDFAAHGKDGAAGKR